MRINHSMQKLAEMYIEEIVRLYGISSNIVSDRSEIYVEVLEKCVRRFGY